MAITNSQSAASQQARFAAAVVESAGILDEQIAKAIYAAFIAVKREVFVERNCYSRVYQDISLPTAYGRFMAKPSHLARMLGLLEPVKYARVLEVGCGSGYLSALLAELGVYLFSLESEGLLAQRTRKVLDSLGYQNVIIRTADYSKGWSEHAPYEAIIISDPVRSVPESFISQLDPNGGRLVAVTTDRGVNRLSLWQNRSGLAAGEQPEVVRYDFEELE